MILWTKKFNGIPINSANRNQLPTKGHKTPVIFLTYFLRKSFFLGTKEECYIYDKMKKFVEKW